MHAPRSTSAPACDLLPKNFRKSTSPAACFIDGIHINRTERIETGRGAYWIKERRPISRLIIPIANAFFRAAGNPVVVLAQPREWQQREIGSFLLLHQSEGYTAEAISPTSLHLALLPGEPLDRPAKSGTITDAMLAAAARELYRAHQLPSPLSNGEGWSHGDAHLANFLYEPTADRARLIDFEVTHHPRLTPDERHVDDLFVLLQSTMGYWPEDEWIDHSRLILRSYFEAASASLRTRLLARLIERLAPPSGISRLWWAIRTDYLPAREQKSRITALRRLITP